MINKFNEYFGLGPEGAAAMSLFLLLGVISLVISFSGV